MQLLMYQCLPMQDTLECTDITRVESVSGFSIKEFKVYEYNKETAKQVTQLKICQKSYVSSNGKGTYLSNSMVQ